VVEAGGGAAFGKLADLAGVADELAARGATPHDVDAIAGAMAEPCQLLAELGSQAPDPTPTNRQGGIGSIEAKGRGALCRLGRGRITGVFGFGEPMSQHGLQMMEGTGSAAVCLMGRGAAGCNPILYTVGSTSATATFPLVPVIKVGPPPLRDSTDLDWSAGEGDAANCDLFLDHVCEIASGRPTATEPDEARQIMLPGALPPL
jgi:altronate dehydratase